MNTDPCSSVVSLLVAVLLHCEIRGQLFSVSAAGDVTCRYEARYTSLSQIDFKASVSAGDPNRLISQKIGAHSSGIPWFLMESSFVTTVLPRRSFRVIRSMTSISGLTLSPTKLECRSSNRLPTVIDVATETHCIGRPFHL